MIEPKNETAMFAALHENITNKYIESMFKDRTYEEFTSNEKLELIGVLKRTSKIDIRYRA